MFKALLLTRDGDATRAALTTLDESALPAGDVDIRIEYSTLNYKDALAVTGAGAVVRTWPMVPGIDLAGTVEQSRDPAWQPGERIVVTGCGLGETRWGGLCERTRLAAPLPLRLPAPYSTRDAMAIGTAGFTAALAVLALQRHGLAPGDGEILVTGAAGGVGSVAIALLSALGYRVVASTGRPAEAAYLQALGAERIIERAELAAPGKPLQKERWAGAIDAVGSHTLANACAQTRAHGAVAACGLAQGGDFPATVMPFILRGVALYGIHSVELPQPQRLAAWALLAQHLDPVKLPSMTTEIGLSEVIAVAPRLLAGEVRGRLVVDVGR